MNYTIKNRPEFMTTKYHLYGVEGFFVETLDLITTVCAWASLLKAHLFFVQAYRSFHNTNRGFPLANLRDVSFGKELSKSNTNLFFWL
jgi:hypothetical protein